MKPRELVHQSLRRQSTLRFVAAALWLSIAVLGCVTGAGDDPGRAQQIVDRIRQQHAPDKRVEVFNVSAQAGPGSIVLTGEVQEAKFVSFLVDSITAAMPAARIETKIEVLPEVKLRDKSYGIIKIGVANLRREPSFQSELVNQALLGSGVRILKESGSFYYVQNFYDSYLGWMSKGSLVRTDSSGYAEWNTSDRVMCRVNYAPVVDLEDSETGGFLVDMVPGAVLQRLGAQANFVKVQTPDGRAGFIERTAVKEVTQTARIVATRDKVIATSKNFLGTPYFWGGTSSKGFDCSGFVQTAFRLNNYKLPRDVSQIARLGTRIEEVGLHFENLLPGDVLFFGRTPERLSHCALYLGNQRYIHSSFSVHINSLDPEDQLYNDYRRNAFQQARRLF